MSATHRLVQPRLECTPRRPRPARTASPRGCTIRCGCWRGSGRWASTRARTPPRPCGWTACYHVRRRSSRCRATCAFDPAVVPAEALVESELDDWWTMGRRIRAGADEFARVPMIAGGAELRLPIRHRPMRAFRGHPDGRALWRRARRPADSGRGDFGDDRPPPDSPLAWNTSAPQLSRRVSKPMRRPLGVIDHHGGPLDWYSADADTTGARRRGDGDAAQAHHTGAARVSRAHRTAVSGRSRTPSVDIGGYPPDAAHFATMLLVDLVYSHGDDWFVFPVSAQVRAIADAAIPPGHRLVRTKLFERRPSSRAAGARRLQPLHMRWPAGTRRSSSGRWRKSPLESDPLERVQFGVDEHSNALWALERIVDRRDVGRSPG